jgi:hypothetical protein
MGIRIPRSLVLLGLLVACDGRAGEGTEVQDQGVCPIVLSDLALFQTVKVPLVEEGAVLTSRPIQVVLGKPARVQGYVRAVPGADGGATDIAVQARLLVSSVAGVHTLEATGTVTAASATGGGDTLDFELDASLVAADATVSLDIVEPSPCRSRPQAARLPREGVVPLAPQNTGSLKVVLVPVRYDADGSGRLPDTSEPQLEQARAALLALFPVSSVQISVRAAVGSGVNLAGRSSSSAWAQLLDSLRSLRTADGATDDTYYYGWVAPASTFRGYCTSSCILGVAFQVEGNLPALRVGVGVAYADDQTRMTMAHELAHQHGRLHAPCGATSGLDADYPYPTGSTETWGFDARTGKVIDPTLSDLMSYCSPQWISDYNYQALLERSLEVNGQVASAIAGDRPAARDWEVLLVGGVGSPRAGVRLPGFSPPASARRQAIEVLDDGGGRVGWLDGYELPIADVDVAMVLVPPLPAGGRSLRLEGSASPIRLDRLAAPAVLGP